MCRRWRNTTLKPGSRRPHLWARWATSCARGWKRPIMLTRGTSIVALLAAMNEPSFDRRPAHATIVAAQRYSTDSKPDGFAPLPRQRPWASAGFRWWRRDVAPAQGRGVLDVPAQTWASCQGAGSIQSAAEGSPQRRAQQASEFEAGAGAGAAAPAERRHHRGDHDLHGLAAAHGTGGFLPPAFGCARSASRKRPSRDRLPSGTQFCNPDISHRDQTAWLGM